MARHHHDCEGQVRQALGEAAFTAAHQRGLELPAEDALAFALRQPVKKTQEIPPAVAGAPLTARQLRVARLGCRVTTRR